MLLSNKHTLMSLTYTYTYTWTFTDKDCLFAFNFHNLEGFLNPSLQWSNILQGTVLGYTVEVEPYSITNFS